MLKQLKIENFRCFKSFELNHLGRVNLLVGKNNSGKTSILEAVYLLTSRVDKKILFSLVSSREECSDSENSFDISFLFHGHEIQKQPNISISSKNPDVNCKSLTLNFEDKTEQHEMFKRIKKYREKLQLNKVENLLRVQDEIYTMLSKEVGFDIKEKSLFYSIENKNKIKKKLDLYDIFFEDNDYFLSISNSDFLQNRFFLSTSFLNSYEMEKLFNMVILEPEENLVYQALQIIEPRIQRIAPIRVDKKNSNSRGGFYVKLSDSDKRIPIGSMGDGVWRMLGLSLALVAAKDGVLLVDEIDTGLHYTALEDMWKLIWETAKKLNVQVFATTHSRDCWESMEVLAHRDDVEEEDISIQRIEKDTPRSVVFNKKGIATAAKREIEVR